MRVTLTVLIVAFGPTSWAVGQSSSLFKRSQARKAARAAATTRPAADGAWGAGNGKSGSGTAGRSADLTAVSLTAVRLPEPKVLKVNDLMGVIVRYRLRHQTTAKTKQDSEWDLNAKLSAWFRIHDRTLLQQAFRGGTPEVKFKSANELENKGKADRKDVFETRIMAKVVDIKPNGNLIIVAWSNMEIDDEVQYLRLTGECNKDHISPDGTITSDRVFGLDVQTMNEGAVRDAVKRGWFKEFLDGWKPF